MTERTAFRGYRYRLAPTGQQAATLAQWAGVCRLVYNLALEQRRDFWRQAKRAGTPITFASQCRELTALRAEFDFIREVPSDATGAALRDLDKAYAAFFSGRAGYPSPRRRGQNDSATLRGRGCPVKVANAKWAMVRLPKLGWVKFRLTRAVPTDCRTVTVAYHAGAWSLSFAAAIPVEEVAPLSASVGIDRGIANTLSLSTGEHLSLPASIQAVERQRRKAQRVLARRRRGSARYGKQRARVASLKAREARIRRDWLHRASTAIARRFGAVAIEDLKIANMTASARGTVDEPGAGVAQKAGLNRSILNQGWYAFEAMLTYKLEERGGTLVKVPAPYTSQTCQACGVIDRRSRESQSSFACVHCGHRDHADTNAALEILRRSTASQLVEGARWRPDETRTKRSVS